MAGEGVVAKTAAADFLDHHIAVGTGIRRDLTDRGGERTLDDLDTGALIPSQFGGQAAQPIGQLQQQAAPTGHDALFDGSAGGVEGILNPQLAIAQFGFGGSAHLDHGHTTGQLGDPFVQLFAVVVRIGGLQLPFDRCHPLAYGCFACLIGHDRGLVLGDRDPVGPAQILKGGALQAHRPVFGNHLAAGQHGDVLEHGLAPIAETRCPDCGHLQHSAGLVDHQGGQGLTFHVLGQDHQRPAAAGHGLQHRHQIGHGPDLAVGDQQQRILKDAFTPLLIGDEIRGGIAAIKRHAFGDLQLGGQGL